MAAIVAVFVPFVYSSVVVAARCSSLRAASAGAERDVCEMRARGGGPAVSPSDRAARRRGVGGLRTSSRTAHDRRATLCAPLYGSMVTASRDTPIFFGRLPRDFLFFMGIRRLP